MDRADAESHSVRRNEKIIGFAQLQEPVSRLGSFRWFSSICFSSLDLWRDLGFRITTVTARLGARCQEMKVLRVPMTDLFPLLSLIIQNGLLINALGKVTMSTTYSNRLIEIDLFLSFWLCDARESTSPFIPKSGYQFWSLCGWYKKLNFIRESIAANWGKLASGVTITNRSAWLLQLFTFLDLFCDSTNQAKTDFTRSLRVRQNIWPSENALNGPITIYSIHILPASFIRGCKWSSPK